MSVVHVSDTCIDKKDTLMIHVTTQVEEKGVGNGISRP
jgi:hypothetical protein